MTPRLLLAIILSAILVGSLIVFAAGLDVTATHLAVFSFPVQIEIPPVP
jgi:hypothetical protein